MFSNLSQLLNPEEPLSPDLQPDNVAHLKSIEDEFKNYFPDLNCSEEAFVTNPFSSGLDITVIADEILDELLELRHDSSARVMFLEKTLTVLVFTPGFIPSCQRNSTSSYCPICL